MASILLSFGAISQEEIDEISEQLQKFLGSVISEEYWGAHTPHCFGPIVFVGALKAPQHDTYTIFMQAWREYADTLFCMMDAFFGQHKIAIEYERDDSF